MLVDTETMLHINSYSSVDGTIDLELEAEVPALGEKINQCVLFLAMYCTSLVIIKGVVCSYEKVEADPDIPEQDVFARVSFVRTMGIKIDFGQFGKQ